MNELANTLDEVRSRIRHGEKHALNEQNTKATLIEPVLRALGWNIEDVEEVVREFKTMKRDKPVDYGLLLLRKPRLFIEAKALGSNLDDRRWANQIMGYASVAGVEWMVLTDGNEYRIYNTHAPVAVDEKLFRSVKVTDPGADVAQTLELLAKGRLEENRIEVLWRAQFIDRQVEAALYRAFAPDNDMLLVNYVAGQTENLTAEEIRDSLRRCHVSLDFPLLLDLPAPVPKAPGKGGKAKSPPASIDVALQDLVASGLLPPGTKLARIYKGKPLTATVDSDGRVRFAGEIYNSPSMAAGAARATVIGVGKDGKLPPTNGWTFWEANVGSGKPQELSALRAKFLKQAGGAEGTG